MQGDRTPCSVFQDWEIAPSSDFVKLTGRAAPQYLQVRGLRQLRHPWDEDVRHLLS